MADAIEGLEAEGHRRLSGEGRYQEGSARQTWLSKPAPPTAQLQVWATRAIEPTAAGPGMWWASVLTRKTHACPLGG